MIDAMQQLMQLEAALDSGIPIADIPVPKYDYEKEKRYRSLYWEHAEMETLLPDAIRDGFGHTVRWKINHLETRIARLVEQLGYVPEA